MASRKRKASGGWGNMINKRKSEYTKTTKSLERDFVAVDRINIHGIILSRKRTEKSQQEVTLVVGDVHPGCIGSNATNCKYIEEGDSHFLRIKPVYSYKTKQSFSGREKWLENYFPITEKDNFDVIPGRIYKAYCKVTKIPPEDFVVVNVTDFNVTCDVGEPWGSNGVVGDGDGREEKMYEKSFFVHIGAMDQKAKPRGTPLLQLLYSSNAITRELPHYSEFEDEIRKKVDAAEAFKSGCTDYGASLMNEMWSMRPWQNRWMPLFPDVLIFQLGSRAYFMAEYFKHLPSGVDSKGRQFIFSPLGEGSVVHDDDVMEFKTRTSQLDDTPIPGWRFIAYVFQAKVKEDSLEKDESDITPKDLVSKMEHTVKVSMFMSVCLQMGFPEDLDYYEPMVSAYYQYFPFALSCRLDTKGTKKRPENNNDQSAYAVVVENVIGPVREFWETIGIPVSKEMAERLLESNRSTGSQVSRESFPSDCNGVYCLADMKNKETVKDIIKKCDKITDSLFIVICKNTSNGILYPGVYRALKDFDVWNSEDENDGDIVADILAFESAYDDETLEEHPKALKLLEELNYFKDDESWELMKNSIMKEFLYSTRKATPMSETEQLAVRQFLGS